MKKLKTILFDILGYSIAVAVGIGLIYAFGFFVETIFKFFGV